MIFRRQKLEEANVNLTPLIDVVFLLLIFFMVSTTFTKENRLTLELPEADGERVTEQEPESLEIVISEQGEYTLNGSAVAPPDLKTLMAAISELSKGDATLPIILTADANTPHQAVVRAMDAAGQLGFGSLSLTTRQPERRED